MMTFVHAVEGGAGTDERRAATARYFYGTFAYWICFYGIYFYGIYIYVIYFYRALKFLNIDLQM
jgi:hypothetical protein